MTRVAPNDTWMYTRYFVFWIGLIVTCAFVYHALGYLPGNGLVDSVSPETNPHDFRTALYFSIVTGTTVGYGDILPHGFSRGLAAIEAILSFVLLAGFVTQIASRRQDIAIADLHSLAKDSLFNNFRHALYISRKDIDRIINKIDAHSTLDAHDWRNVYMSLRHIQTQIRKHVPELYANDRHLGAIDEDHEQLILDSVERTLKRVRELVDALETTGTTCSSDERCSTELESIVRVSRRSFGTLLPRPYHMENTEAFDEMLARLEELSSIQGA